MLKILQSTVLVAFMLVGVVSGQEVGPDDVIRVKTALVNSPVLVIGRDGKFVPNLGREDFQVFENGVKQEISYFAAVDNPFTVALVIDTSRSTVFNLADIQHAALAFVDQMRPRDRAVVVSFSDDFKVITEATSDRETLRSAIASIRPGGGSRVYDAVDLLVEEMNRIEGRTALILFSDGVDNDSQTATGESTLRKVERSDTLIYPVQFSTYERMKSRAPAKTDLPTEGTGFSEQDYRVAGAYLRRLADATSTGVYPAAEISDLDRAIASIVDELHNEYSIGYYPRNAGQAGEQRRVEVRVNRPQLVVRARTGYVVDKSGAVVRTARTSQRGVSIESDASLPVTREEEKIDTASDGRWMCKSPQPPVDMVIVKEGFVSHCRSRADDRTNAWFIKKPGRSETMCKAFFVWNDREVAAAPLPEGYVVIGEVKSAACGNSRDASVTTNAWEIRRPGPSETVCKGFPLPHGYVMVGERVVPNCPPRATDQNAWLISRNQ
ncbi:MAG TPA: VWA domain-containing protein [Pyrinomonadaceae bacterium]|nr:VWA domain-containing protein [Pyrinomonadaceae bacterium]